MPSGGFFSAKKASTNQIMRIYYKIGVFVCFSKHGKDAHRDSAKVALNDSSRSLIWNFWEQIVFLETCEKVSKVSNLDQFWVHPRWS